MMTPSPIGAIPLAVFLTNTMTKEAYAASFGLLKKEMGEEAFFGQKYPSVGMTDDSKAERDGFQEVWPETKLLLCLFHVPQAVWRWIYNANHGIDHRDRQSLMHDFQLLIRAKSESEAFELYEKCHRNPVAKKYSNWLAYLGDYWKRRALWCMAYR